MLLSALVWTRWLGKPASVFAGALCDAVPQGAGKPGVGGSPLSCKQM